MKTSKNGIELLKKFEGCRLKAYKCFSWEKYYTIGYGHYGADVKASDVITQEKAEELLIKDLAWCEKAVNKLKLPASMQNFFDALVSFTYNCGENNLQSLTNGRDYATIADKILLYNKSGGVMIKGLVERRNAERALMMQDLIANKDAPQKSDDFYPTCAYKGVSLVDALKSIGVDVSFSNRKKIAEKNGFGAYSGLAGQNLKLLEMLKNGTLRK